MLALILGGLTYGRRRATIKQAQWQHNQIMALARAAREREKQENIKSMNANQEAAP